MKLYKIIRKIHLKEYWINILNLNFFYFFLIQKKDELGHFHDVNLLKRYFPEFGEYETAFDFIKLK